MAGRRSPVTDIREILRRLQLGEPDRRIARDLDVSRKALPLLLATEGYPTPGRLPQSRAAAPALERGGG